MSKRTPWSDNRSFFEWVEPEAWKWFEDAILQDNQIRVLICAGSRNAARILRFFKTREAWIAGKLPYPIKVIGVCSEKITDAVDARAANAHKRFTRYLLDYSDELEKLLDPDLSMDEYARIWTSNQGTNFRNYVRSIEEWAPKFDVPLTYLDPNTDEGFDQVCSWSRRRNGRPPFNMIVSNPYRNWISYRLRKIAGEVSETISRGSKKRQLLTAQGYRLFGLCFGFHPTLLVGRPNGLEFMEGASPVDYYLRRKLRRGRLAMMGLGPKKMDDRDLWCFDGPISDFGLNKKAGFDESPEKNHEFGYKIVEWIWDSMEPTLRGDYHHGLVGIGAAIAEQVNALYLHERNGG